MSDVKKREIKVDDTDRVTDFKDEIKYEIGVQEKISGEDHSCQKLKRHRIQIPQYGHLN